LRAVAADHELAHEQILGRLDAGVRARVAAAMGDLRAADPIEFQRIVVGVGLAHERIIGDVAADHAERAAVLRGLVVEVIGRD
jgi:hypothetical protein